ncbi:KTSC domain-containing protein [Devosia albogilva]|uniref:KTSC domain-containing protein n=1 Tax=Devosia albogilva TaxID=429726 RepID=A0ABW5QKH5_9HYPH
MVSGRSWPLHLLRRALEVYLELLEAESKGRYFAAHIRDRFEYSPPVVP